MACRNTCRAWQPCYSAGCSNAPPPSTNMPFSPGPNSQRRGANSRNGSEEPYSCSNDNVTTGAEDINIDLHVDRVLRGGDSVRLGVGNTARKDLTLRVSGIRVANLSHEQEEFEEEFDVGGSNRNSNMNRGRQGSVRIGVGNRSAGDARIVISGNRMGPTTSANCDYDYDYEDDMRRDFMHRGRERWSFPFGDRRRY